MPTVTADKTYYVDLCDAPDFPTGTFKSVYPEGLTFDDQIRGVGNCTFQLSYGAKDQDGNPAVTLVTGDSQTPFIGPYRSYYRLRYGSTAIQAGVVVSTNTKLGSDYMSIAGKTWEHLLEKWQYPYNPILTERVPGDLYSSPAHDYDLLTAGNGPGGHVSDGDPPPPDLVYMAFDKDVLRVLYDILNMVIYGVPLRAVLFDLSRIDGATSGITTNYNRSRGDMSYINSFVDDQASVGQGFDWWISWDRKFYWAAPYRFGSAGSPNYLETVDSSNPPQDIEFTNNGPVATHVTGTGAGTNSANKIAVAYGYDQNQIIYGRTDANYDFGDRRNKSVITKLTQKQLTLDVQPQHVIPIQFDPRSRPTFWADYRVGRAIFLYMNMGYHWINSGQRLKSYTASMDEVGNVLVDWTLEQIYDLGLSAGVEEG